MNDSNFDFDARVNEVLVNHNLDFTVDKVQMVAPKVMMGVNELGELTELTQYIHTPYFALMNSKSGEVINSVKKGYTVSQNKEVVELVLRGMEPFGDKLDITKGGSLNGGRRIFLQLGIEGDGFVNGDRIKRFVTIVDSNDGSTGLSIGIGDTTMSCLNQMFYFYKLGHRMRHTYSISEKMNAIPMMIETALAESMKKIELYQKMEGVKITDADIHNMVLQHIAVSKKSPIIDLSEASTRVINSMESLYANIYKEIGSKGRNVWGLHSGVTSWTTHDKSAKKRENGRLEGLMVGTNYRTNQKSFDFALDLL